MIDPLNYSSDTYFHQDDSRLGKTERQENPVNRVINTYKSDATAPYFTPLIQTDEYANSKCKRTGYEYDDYGNITKQINYGDIDLTGDESSVLTDFSINSSAWLINLPSRERRFGNLGGTGVPASETQYFYDNNPDFISAPVKGELTKTRRFIDTINDYVQNTSTYDTYGNMLTQTDANVMYF